MCKGKCKQKLVPEYAIDEVVMIKGKKVEVVEDHEELCSNCDLNDQADQDDCVDIKCCDDKRSDKKFIILKLTDKPLTQKQNKEVKND